MVKYIRWTFFYEYVDIVENLKATKLRDIENNDNEMADGDDDREADNENDAAKVPPNHNEALEISDTIRESLQINSV